MDGVDRLRDLQLKNHHIFNNEIQTLPRDLNTFVRNKQFNLTLGLETTEFEFTHEGPLVHTLQQARTEMGMHLHRGTDDTVHDAFNLLREIALPECAWLSLHPTFALKNMSRASSPYRFSPTPNLELP